MAGVTLGFLKYVLGLDTLSFRKGMTDAERNLVKLQKSFEAKGRQIQSLGNKLSVGLTLPLVAFAARGIKEAQETQAAMGQVNAAIASMGPVAGRTSAQLSNLADQLEMKSLFEADEILTKVTANLLTFGNISGQTFDRAQQAAVDLATRMGTDLQSATILVGKALNDPIKGMGALGKAGIQFSADQKAAIKALVDTGNAAGAQSIILKELERQFAGSAAAAQNTDPWNRVTDAFNQMAEKVGTALLPLIPPLTDAIVSIATAFTSLSPETQKWVLIVGAAAIALGPLLTGLGGLITVISSIGPLVLGLSKAWAALQVVLTAARVASLALLPALGPFLIPLAAIAAAVGSVYLVWKNWDKIVAIVQRTVAGVNAWLGKLNFNQLKRQVSDAKGYFADLHEKVVGHSYIPDMVDGIAAEMARLDAVMVQPAKAATTKAAEAFQALQQRVQGLLQQLFPQESAANQFKNDLADLKEYADKAGWSIEQLNESIIRLQAQYDKGLPSTLPEGIDQGPLVDIGNSDIDVSGIGDSIRTNIDDTRRWKDALSEVGNVLLDDISASLEDIVRGTGSLKDLWKSLLATGISLLTSPNGPLGSLLSGARANGGPVLSGGAYLVGERGPEIFTPGRSGRIISNDNSRRMMGGSGGVNMTIYTNDADSFRRSQSQIARDTRRRLGV